jgi:2OG-Fe(II) oxygenase superfamily
MNLNILEEKIFYYENVIDNPYNFIELIELNEKNIAGTNSGITEWKKWTASNDDYIFGYQKRISVNIKDEALDNYLECLHISNTIENAIVSASNDYAMHHKMDIGSLTPLSISKYQLGASMGSHVDSYGDDTSPTISVVLYLNDDYEGGEIYFKEQDIEVKPSAGSLIIFPSYEPYYHESKPIVSGVKYMTPGFWYKR